MDDFLAQLTMALNLPEGTLVPAQNLRALPNWDSLAVLTTLALVDECFGVQLSGEALSECQNVADLCTAIERARGH
ncbi:MAG: hypothetical protein RL648_823 [Verrucomicrobiota bacterium]|jgi:acyl carrier protein